LTYGYEKLVPAHVAGLRRGAGAIREKALDCGEYGAAGVEGSGCGSLENGGGIEEKE